MGIVVLTALVLLGASPPGGSGADTRVRSAEDPARSEGAPSKVSLMAVWPWSPRTHELFPPNSSLPPDSGHRSCALDPALRSLGIECDDLGIPQAGARTLHRNEPWLDLGDPDDEVVGYIQPTEDRSAGIVECGDNAPHSSPNCFRPVAKESDWHLQSSTGPSPPEPPPLAEVLSPEGSDFWTQRCRTSPGDLAGMFEWISAGSGAFEECATIGCDRLVPEAPDADMRSGVLREVLSLWLNLATHRLTMTTSIDLPALTEATTVGEVLALIEPVICDPASGPEDLAKARVLAKAIND